MAYSSDLVRTKNWGTEVLKDTDLEGQLDLIIDWVMAHANETTGHKHDATENEGPKLVLTAAAAVSGVLPVANGGTGQSTLATFLNLVYPVGSLYFNDEVSTNPGTLLGFGTWTAITEKFIIGVGTDTDFDAAKETGGAKTYDLSHDHGGNTGGVESSTDGLEYAGILDTKHQHSIASDGSATQSVMNPYYAAYIWRRSV